MDSNLPFNFSSNFMDLLTSQQQINTSEAFPPISATNNDQNQTQITTNDRREVRHKWSSAEDSVLISAWLNTSKDPIVGNEQKANAFWKRIAAYYASSPAVENLPKREFNNCKQRWHKINDIVCKFVGCYDHALSQRTSGQSEDDVLQVAYQFYFNDYNTNFTLEHCWRELRHDQKWCSSNNSQREKGTASSKRTKLDEGGAYSSSSNTESNVDEQAEARPIGVKAAKRKGKKVVTKTRIEEREASSRTSLEKLWELKEKDIVERKQLSRMNLLKSLLGKTGELSEKEETLKNKLINELL